MFYSNKLADVLLKTTKRCFTETRTLNPDDVILDPLRRCLEESWTESTVVPVKKCRQQSDFDKIPEEIVFKIFSYLKMEDLLLRVALVCKDWRDMSIAPPLWKCLDLSGRSNVTTEIVNTFLQRSDSISCVKLNSCPIEDSAIAEIVKQKNLQRLSLSQCQSLTAEIFPLFVDCTSLLHLNLVGLEIVTDEVLEMISEWCPNLRILNISHCFEVTTAGVLPVVRRCTGMKRLSMNCCYKVDDDFLIELATLPIQLEALHIVGIQFTSEGLIHLGKLQKVVDLFASHIHDLTDDLVSRLSNLIYLDIDSCQEITNNGIAAITRNNPKLQNLSLIKCLIDDKALEIISSSPCRLTLEDLVVSDCSVSEVGIERVLKSCTKLSFLRIKHFARETVDKWEREFPRVTFQLDVDDDSE